MKRLSAALLFAALASISAHALDLPLPLAQAAPAATPEAPPQPPQLPPGVPNPNGLPPGQLPPGFKLPPGVTLPPLPPGITNIQMPPGMNMPPLQPGQMPPGMTPGQMPNGMPGAPPSAAPGPRPPMLPRQPMAAQNKWAEGITQAVGNLGQGNWIVVADSAFPFFSSPAIQTALLPAESADVLKRLLEDLDAAKHLKATVYTESEFSGVNDAAAPGASAHKEQVTALLKDAKAQALSHAALIAKIQEASKTYRILVVKTTTKLPNSAVFIELATNPHPGGEPPAPAAAPSKPAGEPAAKPKPKK